MRRAAVCGLLLAAWARADVYSCGEGCYTQTPTPRKAKLSAALIIYRDAPETVPTQSTGAPRVAASARTNAAPPKHAAPKADKRPAHTDTPQATQTAAKPAREQILQQELRTEQQALAQAEAMLQQVQRSGGNTQHWQNAVNDRRQNIQALERELKQRR